MYHIDGSKVSGLLMNMIEHAMQMFKGRNDVLRESDEQCQRNILVSLPSLLFILGLMTPSISTKGLRSASRVPVISQSSHSAHRT
jgi:hypothetical protein